MGNWGFVTPISGVIILLLTGDGAQVVGFHFYQVEFFRPLYDSSAGYTEDPLI